MTERTRILPAGNDATRAGFTLLELLVVLSIVAGIAAVVVAYLPRGGTETQLRASGRMLASSLRFARSEAIAQNRSVAVMLDLEKRRYRVGDKSPETLPDDIDVMLYTATSEAIDAKVGSLRFFPDGSSTGGRVHLRPAGGKKDAQVISVDWATGRVSLSK